MKHTSTMIPIAILTVLCLLLCAGSVFAEEYTMEELASAELVQPGDNVCPSDDNSYYVEFVPVWELIPEPTPTPEPPVEPTPTRIPGWIPVDQMPKTGYGPDSRPYLYGLGALALGAMLLARRKRSE